MGKQNKTKQKKSSQVSLNKLRQFFFPFVSFSFSLSHHHHRNIAKVTNLCPPPPPSLHFHRFFHSLNGGVICKKKSLAIVFCSIFFFVWYYYQRRLHNKITTKQKFFNCLDIQVFFSFVVFPNMKHHTHMFNTSTISLLYPNTHVPSMCVNNNNEIKILLNLACVCGVFAE